MKNWPVRTLAVAVLLATSASAQVMAGVDGPMTARVLGWLAGTVLAAGAAAMLTSSSSDQKIVGVFFLSYARAHGASQKTFRLDLERRYRAGRAPPNACHLRQPKRRS